MNSEIHTYTGRRRFAVGGSCRKTSQAYTGFEVTAACQLLFSVFHSQQFEHIFDAVWFQYRWLKDAYAPLLISCVT